MTVDRSIPPETPLERVCELINRVTGRGEPEPLPGELKELLTAFVDAPVVPARRNVIRMLAAERSTRDGDPLRRAINDTHRATWEF
jgi:hypothetical protein